MIPSVEDLRSAGGWLIEDPARRHAESPESFWIPDESLKATIVPGSLVKLIFLLIGESEDGESVVQGERMWVLVEERDAENARGRLNNQPSSRQTALQLGQPVAFRTGDVIDVLDPADDWTDERDSLRAVYEGDDAFDRWRDSNAK